MVHESFDATKEAVTSYEFTMSLRIRHPDADPALITRTLGLQPQHSWRAGEPRQGATGESPGGTYHESYWMCRLAREQELPTETPSVEGALLQALSSLRRSFDFVQQLHATGGAAEIQINIFASQEFRIELLAEAAALLGRMGITMAIDVKPLAAR
ncbi:MAG TPA: DUF4279 domain-containing protein [Steroidobacteraceae bacterium]|jgi:hypothetical protein